MAGEAVSSGTILDMFKKKANRLYCWKAVGCEAECRRWLQGFGLNHQKHSCHIPEMNIEFEAQGGGFKS